MTDQKMQVRERVEKYGPKCLFNFEALSLVTGIKAEKLAPYSSLADLKSKRSLLKVTPLQKHKLDTLFELCDRFNGGESSFTKITSPDDIFDKFRSEMGQLKKEEFRLVTLNTKNMITGVSLISVGSLNASIVHPREVFRPAILDSAAAVILVHNHPSGIPDPSREDIEITQRLVEAGQLIGIKVLDHIIVCSHRYRSLKMDGHI